MSVSVHSFWAAIAVASYLYIFKVDERSRVAAVPQSLNEKMEPHDWFVHTPPAWVGDAHLENTRVLVDSHLIQRLYGEPPRAGLFM